jgi:hypothetical protein
LVLAEFGADILKYVVLDVSDCRRSPLIVSVVGAFCYFCLSTLVYHLSIVYVIRRYPTNRVNAIAG